MKTSELIKKLRESEYARWGEWKEAHQRADRFTSLIINDDVVAQFSPIGKWLYIFEDCPKDVRLLLSEYTSTPLEEREEEKKYRLKMPKEFNAGGLYVLKQECIENYFFKSYHFENAQSIFTQKEIDAMLFDTSFFIKEEVK